MGKHTKTSRYTFADWIDELTPQKIAQTFEIHEETVRYWRKGRSSPKPVLMHRIMLLTKGAVDCNEIVRHRMSSRYLTISRGK